MTRSGVCAVASVAVILSTPALSAQDGRYRDYQLGATLASIATLTSVPTSEAKTVHARPVLMQDLQWRRPYGLGSGTAAAAPDPVQQIAFSFYNDQLFKIVIDYDRERTEGMTDADMVEGISKVYGASVKPMVKPARASVTSAEEENGTRVARWGNAEYTAVLYRSSYASGFRMIVTSVRLSALARTGEAQALRLDEREAPQRERERQKREVDDARVSQQKSRVANKAAFVP